MIWWILIELAIGEFKPDITSPDQTFSEVCEYLRYTPSLMGVYDVLRVGRDLDGISRSRFIEVPLGHSIGDAIMFVRYPSNYGSDISVTESILVNDWLTVNNRPISLGTGIAELRKSLNEFMLRDGFNTITDTYVRTYYTGIIRGLYNTSRYMVSE